MIADQIQYCHPWEILIVHCNSRQEIENSGNCPFSGKKTKTKPKIFGFPKLQWLHWKPSDYRASPGRCAGPSFVLGPQPSPWSLGPGWRAQHSTAQCSTACPPHSAAPVAPCFSPGRSRSHRHGFPQTLLHQTAELRRSQQQVTSLRLLHLHQLI